MRTLTVCSLVFAALVRAGSATAQPVVSATPACDPVRNDLDVAATTAAIERELLSLQGASHPQARAVLERAEALAWSLCHAGDHEALAHLALVHVSRGEDAVALSYLDAFATDTSPLPTLRSEGLGGFFERQRDRLLALASEVRITGVPDDALVTVDGVRVRRRMFRVLQGSTLSAVALIGGTEHRATLRVQGAQEQLRFRTAPRADADVVRPPEAPPTPRTRGRLGPASEQDLTPGRGTDDGVRPRYRPSVALLTVLTAATAAWVTTLVSGAVALERTTRFNASCPRDPAEGSACLELLDDRNLAATVSVVGFAVGLATSLTSLAIWSAEQPARRQAARVSIDVTGGAVQLSATVRF